MKLLDWMRDNGIGDEAFAKMVGDCTSHAVKKWKYGERRPSGNKILRIEEVTKSEVTLRDLVQSPPTAPSDPGEPARVGS